MAGSVLTRTRAADRPAPSKPSACVMHSRATPSARPKREDADSTRTATLRRPSIDSARSARNAARTDPSVQQLAARAHSSVPEARDAGAQTAQQRVQVNQAQVDNQRAGVIARSNRIDQDARSKADALFNRQPPYAKGVSVTNTTGTKGDQVTLTRRDTSGNVVEQESATRSSTAVTYQHTVWDHGTATTNRLFTGPNGLRADTAASWHEDPSKSPTVPTATQLTQRSNSGDKSVQVVEHVSWNENGRAAATDLTAGPSGYVRTTSRYGTQNGTSGLHGDLSGQFKNGPTDVVTTDTIVAKRGEAARSWTDTTYAQGNVRATAHDEQGRPRAWILDKQTGPNDSYSQTFIEGHPEVTAILHRHADSNAFREQTDTKGPRPEDNSTTLNETRYDRNGGIALEQSHSSDDAGHVQDLVYRRTVKKTSNGQLVDESVTASTQDPKSGLNKLSSDTKSLTNGRDTTVLSTTETISGSNGVTATSTLGPDGAHVVVNGREVPQRNGMFDFSMFPPEARQVGAQTFADRIIDIKKKAQIAANAGQSLALSTGFGHLGGDPAKINGSANQQVEDFNAKLRASLGNEVVDKAFAVQKGALAGTRGALSFAGVVASSYNFVTDIQHGDALKAAFDGGQLAGNAVLTASAAQEFNAVFRNGAAGAKIAEDSVLGKSAGPVALAVGLAANGYTLLDGINTSNDAKIESGAVGVGGTIGAATAAGGIGGPAGALAGLTIGVWTYDIQQIIGAIHANDIAAVQI